MHLYCFSLITSEIFQVSVPRESYDGYVKHERNNPTCNPGFFQGNGKSAVSISVAFNLDFLIRNENLIS